MTTCIGTELVPQSSSPGDWEEVREEEAEEEEQAEEEEAGEEEEQADEQEAEEEEAAEEQEAEGKIREADPKGAGIGHLRFTSFKRSRTRPGISSPVAN